MKSFSVMQRLQLSFRCVSRSIFFHQAYDPFLPLLTMAMRPCPPRKVRKHFLTRYTVKNWISNLYILLKSALKMQEMPFQRPKFQTISGEACPRTPIKLCRHYGLPLTKILAKPPHLPMPFGFLKLSYQS